MGVVADATLAGGGRVVGVIPDPLAAKEVAHRGVTELIVVPGMHERKAKMAERAAGFLTLPGGVGTLEEFFEIITWAGAGTASKADRDPERRRLLRPAPRLSGQRHRSRLRPTRASGTHGRLR